MAVVLRRARDTTANCDQDWRLLLQPPKEDDRLRRPCPEQTYQHCPLSLKRRLLSFPSKNMFIVAEEFAVVVSVFVSVAAAVAAADVDVDPEVDVAYVALLTNGDMIHWHCRRR